jgi:DNA-binding transcriptional LysR family regulator
VLDAVEVAEGAIRRRRAAPAGLVRLGCPSVFGRLYVAPRIGALLARYAELCIELVMTDDVVDMVQEGLDLTLRVGEVTDATVVARRVGATTSLVVASPDYLAQRGAPQQPADLAGHDCVIFSRAAVPESWNFSGADGLMTVPVSGRLRVNSIEAVLQAAITGVGVALVPTWMLREELRNGQLVSVLQAWQPPRRPISLVYPSRRFLAPRTRAVIDFIVDEFRLDPVISAYGVS